MASRVPETAAALFPMDPDNAVLAVTHYTISALSYAYYDLEGEKKQERHHKTEETHGLGQGKS